MDNPFLTGLQRSGRVDLEPASNSENESDAQPTPASSAENQSEEEKSPSHQGESGSEDTGTGNKKPEGETGSDEDHGNTDDDIKIPFHKHPRWISLQNDLKKEKEFRESVTPLLERLGQTPDHRTEETVKIPEWFTELFGENEDAWKKYRAYDSEQRKQLRTEIVKEMQGEQQKLVDDQKKQEKWVDDEVAKLSDEGLKFDRNKLLKIALDYLPTDEDGNISFRKAYDILVMQGAGKELDKPKSEAKKKLADQTMGKGKSSEEKRDYKTSADLRFKTMHDLIPRE